MHCQKKKKLVQKIQNQFTDFETFNTSSSKYWKESKLKTSFLTLPPDRH
jgi:hypothetical protein